MNIVELFEARAFPVSFSKKRKEQYDLIKHMFIPMEAFLKSPLNAVFIRFVNESTISGNDQKQPPMLNNYYSRIGRGYTLPFGIYAYPLIIGSQIWKCFRRESFSELFAGTRTHFHLFRLKPSALEGLRVLNSLGAFKWSEHDNRLVGDHTHKISGEIPHFSELIYHDQNATVTNAKKLWKNKITCLVDLTKRGYLAEDFPNQAWFSSGAIIDEIGTYRNLLNTPHLSDPKDSTRIAKLIPSLEYILRRDLRRQIEACIGQRRIGSLNSFNMEEIRKQNWALADINIFPDKNNKIRILLNYGFQIVELGTDISFNLSDREIFQKFRSLEHNSFQVVSNDIDEQEASELISHLI